MTFVTDIFGDLLRPLRVLLVAILGLVFAVLFFEEHYGLAALCIALAVGLALLLDQAGQMALPQRPRLALFLFEFWILAPGAAAAAGAGAVVILGVERAPPVPLDPETAVLVKATVAALSAFVTAGFVSWVGEADSSRVAGRIKRHFFNAYKRAKTNPPPSDGKKYFAAESRGERAVYSTEFEGLAGWGIAARWQRAQILAEELASGNSDSPPP